jgi:hypothetical protein
MHIIGYEILTAVVMKSTIFWNKTPCSPFNINDVAEEDIASICRVEE